MTPTCQVLFINISDISSWQDESRQTMLKHFVTNTLESIKPELVMCLGSGDLTEAKSSNTLQALLFYVEWKTVIVSSRWEDLSWPDIRGNHINLYVLSSNSSNNYFASSVPEGVCISVPGLGGFPQSTSPFLRSCPKFCLFSR